MDNKIFNGVKGPASQNVCSITGETYDGYGNNAYPFEGRCSDKANELYVIPARLMGVTPDMIAKWGKATIMMAIDEKLNRVA